ncbi:MAG: endonuclease/exonuclease/phosphatase family protein [Bacteriovoracaceae bacterium]|jgi:endonuclease/exonuclease/phosphatase family metal-dependent hydrolase|nr:endonuclease/exonuclease/phosphatase family protein [Bacteriovoracaceae bacterium]
MKLITSNIRFDNPDDGSNGWDSRKSILADTLLSYSPTIIGTQEGRRPQLKELENLLGNLQLADTHREWIERRMYPGQFFSPSSVALLRATDVWLSDTPEIAGSKSFNSAFPRLCNIIEYITLADQKKFLICVVHLDHQLAQTRAEQARVLAEQLSKFNSENLPFAVMGDFNEGPDDEVHSLLHKMLPGIRDPWIEKKLAEQTTYHKFKGSYPEGKRIDWILLSNQFDVKSIEIDKHKSGDTFPSDHFPVRCEIEL